MKNYENNKVFVFLAWLLAFLTALGIGGLFLSGTFMNVMILKIFPLFFHQLIGWGIVILAFLGLIFKLIKLAK